ARRVDVIEQRFPAAVRNVHTSHGHGHHVRARRRMRLRHDRMRRVLAGADDEPRRERAARDAEWRIVHGSPPPTKLTISTSSPSPTSVAANAWRLTMIMLCSTATRLGSMFNRSSSSSTDTGCSRSYGSPLSVIRTGVVLLNSTVRNLAGGLGGIQ